MFDKIKGAFEIYSQSSALNPDPTLRTIEVKMGPGNASKMVIEVLQDLKYKTITYNDIYNEIFTSKAGFEVTIHCLPGSNGQTSIDVEVYAPNNRGKSRKALRYLLNKIKETLSKNAF